MPVYFRETVIEPHKQTFYEHSQQEEVVVNQRPLQQQQQIQYSPQQGQQGIQLQLSPDSLQPTNVWHYTQQTKQVEAPPSKYFYQQRWEGVPTAQRNGGTTAQHYQRQEGQHPQIVQVPAQTRVMPPPQPQKPMAPVQRGQQQIPVQPSSQNIAYEQQRAYQTTQIGSPPFASQKETTVTQGRGPSAVNRYEEHLKQQIRGVPHADEALGDFKFEIVQSPKYEDRQRNAGSQNEMFKKSTTIISKTEGDQASRREVYHQQNIPQQQRQQQQAPPHEEEQNIAQSRPGQYYSYQYQNTQQYTPPQPQANTIVQQELKAPFQQQPTRQFYSTSSSQNQQQQQVQTNVLQSPQRQDFSVQQESQPQQQGIYNYEREEFGIKNGGASSYSSSYKAQQPPPSAHQGYPQYQYFQQRKMEPSENAALNIAQSQQQKEQPQQRFQPPSPISQIDYSNAFQQQQQHHQVPDGFFKSWAAGEKPEYEYYVDIPLGPPPTFTSLGTMDDKVLDDQPYARRVSLDRRRAESEQRRRHHSPVPGAAEHGYLFGGMDFIDHEAFDPYQEMEIQIDPDHARRAKSLERGPPLRRPNDHFGLDFSTITPAERPRDYTVDDQQSYHGYQPLKPKKTSKYTADPNAPLNIVEADNLDMVESDKLVGNTLSNQRINIATELSEEEKMKFCAEFAPPGGFKPDHRAVYPEPKPEEPICFSTSLIKPEYQQKPLSGVNPFKSEVDSGWYADRKTGQGGNVWNRKGTWEEQTKNLDSRAYLPSWAKVPPQMPPPWVRRSNTVHNVWQTAADRGYVPQTDFNTSCQTLVKGQKNPCQQEGQTTADKWKLEQSSPETDAPIISTDNVILPDAAQTPEVSILKRKPGTEKTMEPPVIITRNPFAAVEPIFAKEKKITVHYNPSGKSIAGQTFYVGESKKEQQEGVLI